MKKIFAFLFVFVSFASISFAESYKSNIMAQNLGAADADSEYILETNGNVSVLFRDGKEVKRFTYATNKNIKTVKEENLLSDSVIAKKYDSGLLVEEVTETADFRKTVVFHYHDNSLVFCTISEEPLQNNSDSVADTSETSYTSDLNVVSDNTEKNQIYPVTEYYVRNPTDGRLIGTKHFSTINFAGTTYLIEGDKLYKQYNSKLIYEDEPVFNEDGTFFLKHGDKTYYFSLRGDLIKTESSDGVSTYEYDDDFNLIKQTLIDDYKKTEQYYLNDDIIKIKYFENDELKYETRFDDRNFGSIKTVMQHGKPFADVYYDSDNIRILKIEYSD